MLKSPFAYNINEEIHQVPKALVDLAQHLTRLHATQVKKRVQGGQGYSRVTTALTVDSENTHHPQLDYCYGVWPRHRPPLPKNAACPLREPIMLSLVISDPRPFHVSVQTAGTRRWCAVSEVTRRSTTPVAKARKARACTTTES